MKKEKFYIGKRLCNTVPAAYADAAGTICIILFSILPLFGLILAFKNYSVVEALREFLQANGMDSRILKIIFGNHDLPEC